MNYTIISYDSDDLYTTTYTGKDDKGNECYITIPKNQTSWQYDIDY